MEELWPIRPYLQVPCVGVGVFLHGKKVVGMEKFQHSDGFFGVLLCMFGKLTWPMANLLNCWGFHI